MERQGDGGGGKFRRHQWSATARDALLVVLSVVGGSVDAMVYLGVAQVFPANMTGNTALLGIALSQAHWADLLAGGVALAGFIVGIAAGAAIVDRSRDDALWPSVVTAAVALECAALIAFALEWNLVFAELDGAAVYLLIATAADPRVLGRSPPTLQGRHKQSLIAGTRRPGAASGGEGYARPWGAN